MRFSPVMRDARPAISRCFGNAIKPIGDAGLIIDGKNSNFDLRYFWACARIAFRCEPSLEECILFSNRAFFISAAMSLSLASSASAQLYTPSPSLMNGFIGANTLAHQQAVISSRQGRGNVGQMSSRARATTTYRRNPQVTRRVVDNVSAYAARTSGPLAAQQMRDVLARTDLEQAWAQLTASHGYRPGDAADSLAAYWALNWSMANGRPADERQMAGARVQVRAMMPGNAAFARLDEAQRQAMSETFMLNYILQHDAYGDALKRNDHAMMQRLSDAAEQRFRTEMGMDLRRLDLTSQGFRPRV